MKSCLMRISSPKKDPEETFNSHYLITSIKNRLRSSSGPFRVQGSGFWVKNKFPVLWWPKGRSWPKNITNIKSLPICQLKSIALVFLFLTMLSLRQGIMPILGYSEMVPYEKGEIITIEGKIKDIKVTRNKNTEEDGLHLVIDTPAGEYLVHVAPQWYAEQQDFNFQKGELLSITGSSFWHQEKQNIYAATLHRRFSALPKEQQISLASEAMTTSDLETIAQKYKVTQEEIALIKARVTIQLEKALFPEQLMLRNAKTGQGLWGGRYFKDNMPQNREKIQEEIRSKRKGKRPFSPQFPNPDKQEANEH